MDKAEMFINDCTRNCSNQYDFPECFENGIERLKEYQPWLTPNQTRKVVEIAREDELEYIKYQLDLKLPKTLNYNGVQVDREDFINDFIKAMKDG